jgi:hypothetical protein
VVLVFGVAGIDPGPAHAGRISLDLSSQAQIAGGTLSVSLSIRNSGDDAAHSVVPVLSFGEATVQGESRARLGPREAMAVELRAPATGAGMGRWLYRITVGYSDVNEYPFQALHVGTVSVGDAPALQKIALENVVAEPLADEAELTATIRNMSGEPREVAVSVFLPHGIEIGAPPAPANLEAWGSRQVRVPLVNRTARPDSIYAIFAAAEYADGPAHQVVLVPTALQIVAPESVFTRWRVALWTGAALVVLVWAVGLVWWLVGRRRARSVT